MTQDNEKFVPLTIEEIKKDPNHRQIRIYADGVYDLFHFGHMEQLRQAKTAFPNSYLIVGVSTEEDVLKHKGPTVMTHKERVRSVSLCPYVDEVISHPPWYATPEWTDSIKVDLVSHDGVPYGFGCAAGDCFAPYKKMGRFLETDRTVDISTSELIQRIVTDVDVYKKRNQDRGIA